MQQEFITVTFNRTKIAIRCSDILYVIMSDDYCRIHMFDGNVYCCRMTLKELKKQLNEEFMEVKRGCMVAVSAISDIGDRILLSNGEKICYTKRKKKVLREELQKNQELIIAKISKKKLPLTAEEYRKYYKICDALPFAFTDIEMVFNEEKKAVGLDLPLWERSAGCPGKAALRQDDRKFLFQSFFQYGLKMASGL